MSERGRVAVLEAGETRGLGASVRSLGFESILTSNLAELESALKEARCPLALIAFEQLFPDPQRALRRLRAEAPNVPLVVVYLEGGPRLHLGQRLWAIGAFDYFLPRTRLGEVLPNVLRQTLADAALQQLTPRTDDAQGDPFRMLQSLSAALSNHRQVDSLLRELQRRLPHLMKFEVLEIVFTLRSKPRVYVFQRTALPHEVAWNLVERAFECLNSLGGDHFEASTAEMIHADPAESRGVASPEVGETLLAPMMFCGEIVGCVAVLAKANDPMIDRERQLLQLLAHQLSIGLLHAHSLELAEAASITDPMTGLYNRRHLETVLNEEWDRCTRYHLQLSILIVDIDHFKQVNDLHGHLVGDLAIRRVAEVIRSVVRTTDVVVRWGGEEFLIMMPETNVSGASILFERIRVALRTDPIDVGEHLPGLQLAISGGLASYPMNLVGVPDILIELADSALLAAKRTGRDRVCFADSTGAREPGPQGETEDENKRRYPRISCSLPVTFVPLREFDTDAALALSTVNLSASGIAVRDTARKIERNSYGMVFFEDRQSPYLGRVRWVRNSTRYSLAGIELIRPSDFLARTQNVGVTGRALVIASSPSTIRLAVRCLRSNHLEVDSFATSAAVPADLDVEKYSLLIVSDTALASAAGRAILEVRQNSAQPVQLVVISESNSREKALDLIGVERVQHLISDQVRPEQSLFATLNKLVRGDYFGIRRYLLAGADTKSWVLATATDKRDILEGIRRISLDVDCHPRIQDLLISAVDEMLLNAFVTAGTDTPAPVTVECGADSHILAVGVTDTRGHLNVQDVHGGLELARRRMQSGVPEGLPTAGLGFRIMLDSLSQLVINVEPNRRTEIIGIVDLGKTLKAYRTTAPSLGMFRQRG